jgi:hypothetical protein
MLYELGCHSEDDLEPPGRFDVKTSGQQKEQYL